MKSYSSFVYILIFSLIINFSFAQSFLNGSFENNTAGATDKINQSNAAFNGFMANTNAFGTTGNMDIIRSATWGGGGAQHCTWYTALTGSGTDAFAMTLSAPLVTGTTYTISYWDRKDGAYPGFPVRISLSTVNNAIGTIIYTAPVAPTNNVWIQRTFTFVAPNNGQYIVVTQNGGNTSSWVHVDNFVMNNSASTGGLNMAATATTICMGSSATFTVSGANSYTWNPAATLSSASASIVVATPTTSTIYSVTGSNGGCILTGSITLNVISPSTIAVTPTLSSICPGSSVTLTASGTTSYTWSPPTGLSTVNGSVVVASPTVNTTYTVVGGVGTCTSSAIATVTMAPSPVISIAASPSLICIGSSSTLTATGANNYTWSPPATLSSSSGSAVVSTPNATTTYTVIGSIGTCTSSAVKTVSANSIPTLAVAGNFSLCSGNSITFTASGAPSYSWNIGALTASLSVSPTSNTNYTVTGINANCSSTKVVTVTVVTTPTISVASSPSLICNGSSSTLSAAGANNYTWSPPATLSSSSGSVVVSTPNATTNYTVTGANGTCTTSAVTSVSVNSIPTVAVVGTFSLCSGNSTSFTASGAPSYSWSTGALTASLNVSPTSNTTYIVTGINTNCSSTNVVTVSVISNPTVSITGNTTVCLGESTTLLANNATTYNWNTGPNTASLLISPLVTTSYTVLGANGTCTGSAVQTVSVMASPTITALGSNTICEGQNAQLSVSGANSYTWNNGANSANITVNPQSSFNYSVIGTAINGCTASATSFVYVQATPLIGLSAAQPSICYGTQTQLLATGATNFFWTPSSNLSSANGSLVNASPLSNQIYTVTGSIVFGTLTCSSTGTLALSVIPNSTVYLAGITKICLGQSTNLSAGGSLSYTWSPNSGLDVNHGPNVTANPSVSTTYTVSGSSVAGLCVGFNTINVIVNPLPTAYAGKDTTILYGEYGILNGGGSGVIYTWTGGDNSSLNCINCPTTYINPQVNTCYLIEVENIYGCKNTDEVCVTIDKDFGIYLPNSFTPNADGLNEIFMPKGFGVIDYELFIFNRWGQKLYSGKGNFTKGEIVGWDGTFKGEVCKDDVYVYKIIYTNTARKTQVKTGNLNLLAR